jgi:hypothetical protein
MLPAEALQAAAYIEATFPEVHAFVADPHDALLLGFDLSTAKTIRDALNAFSSRSEFPLDNLIEEFDTWIRARETERRTGGGDESHPT